MIGENNISSLQIIELLRMKLLINIVGGKFFFIVMSC